MNVPEFLRTPNSTVATFNAMEENADMALGITDFTNKMRIYNAISTLSGIEKAKKKIN